MTETSGISDDPSTWIVPKSLVKYEDFFDWWQEIRDTDDALHDAGIRASHKEMLLTLAESYVVLRSTLESVSTHLHIPAHLSKIRTVLRTLCHLGLSTEQTARLVGDTRENVIRSMFFNKPLTPCEVENRKRCEAMLRDGVPQPLIVRECAMTPDQVVKFAQMIGVERVTTCDGLGRELRDEALELRRAGHTNRQIIDLFAERGIQMKSSTISKWVARHGGGA